jgi:hypothetical protein
VAVTIASLAAKLTLDTKNFVAGFAKSSKVAQTFGQQMSSGVMSGILKVSAAFLTVEKGIQLARFGFRKFTEAIGRVAETDKLAQKLGITYGQMQRLSVASKLTGHSVEDFLGGKVKNAGKEIDRAGRFIERFGLNMNELDSSKITGSLGAWRQFSTLLEGLAEKSAAAISPSLERSLIRATHLVDSMSTSLDRLLVRFGGLANLSDKALGFLDQQAQHLANNLNFLADVFGSPKSPVGGSRRMPPNFLGDLIKGGAGGAGARSFAPVSPSGSAVRGSMEAARLIQKSGGDPISMLPPLLQEAVRILKKIDGNTDENQKVGRGTGPLVIAEF